MAHSTNIISHIQLPGSEIQYEIHDAQAIHSVADLGLGAALIFKGTKNSASAITGLTSARVGDVWLDTATNTEYVCIAEVSGTANASAWEALGNIHDAASSDHTHAVTVTGTNAASTVTGSVTVPDVSRTTKKLSASATQGAVTAPTDSVIGAGTAHTISGGLTTTKLKATASGAAVGANGTAKAVTGYAAPTTGTFATGVSSETVDVISGVTPTTATAVTGLGTPTTAAAITTLNTTTIKNPTVTAVTIPNVTGNTSVKASKVSSVGSKTAGTAASWGASVSNGVLSFSWTANTPTAVTLPTFTEVTATNTTLGTALSASSVSTSNVTVATGTAKTTANAVTGYTPTTASFVNGVTTDTAEVVNEVTASTGSALTGLGTATTATVLTGVKVTTQPTITIAANATTGDVTVATGAHSLAVAHDDSDLVNAVTSVSVANPTVTLNGSASTGVTYVDSVTIGTKSASLANGSAAAQKWTQASGTTGTPQ